VYKLAVVPAAGKGTRLGGDIPKIFVEIKSGVTPWSILRDLLTPLVDHIELVLSPWAAQTYGGFVEGDNVGISIQPVPLGMGDAVFCAREQIEKADMLVVVWGDQVNLSKGTIQWAMENYDTILKDSALAAPIVVPLVKIENPYTQYVFSPFGELEKVLQQREGDITFASGWSDVGVFVICPLTWWENLDYAPDGLSISAGLLHLADLWDEYAKLPEAKGTVTGELNFLPFLQYLNHTFHDWVKPLDVTPYKGRSFATRSWPESIVNEARGLNTPEDLEFVRERLSNG
jgi:bifunctional UDP-N-acetylglucosamine pyrophosphorylase / glucosamine-1-phosphate N-acetyltransferase